MMMTVARDIWRNAPRRELVPLGFCLVLLLICAVLLVRYVMLLAA